jgi:hypothetical protein
MVPFTIIIGVCLITLLELCPRVTALRHSKLAPILTQTFNYYINTVG